MLGKDGWDRRAWAGQPGQNSQRRQSGWYRPDKKEKTGWPEHYRRTGQLGQRNWDGTTMTVKLGHDMWDMTSAMTLDRAAQTGQSRQISLDRSARTGKRGQDARK
jgi:hypothetical protein